MKGWGWGTWQMFVLPFVEQQPYNVRTINWATAATTRLFRGCSAMGPATTVTQTRLNSFTCPSDSRTHLAVGLTA